MQTALSLLGGGKEQVFRIMLDGSCLLSDTVASALPFLTRGTHAGLEGESHSPGRQGEAASKNLKSNPGPVPCRLEWNEKVTAPDNYEKQGLLYDTNAGFGRNSKADAVGARGDELADAGVEPESDEGARL